MSEILVVAIRYDGMDAEGHEISLDALGQSLRGAARLLAVTGNFAVTGRYVTQVRSMDVRVVAREPKANCFSIQAVLQFAQQHGLLQGAVMLIPAIIGLVIANAANNHQEMKHLSVTVSKLIDVVAQNNQAQREQFVAIVDRMTDALRPAAKQMVAPVGRTCSSMRIFETTVDEATAAAIRGQPDDSVDELRRYVVQITELDLENRTAKVRLEGIDEKRVRAVITDPALAYSQNNYVSSFASRASIAVSAKAVIREGGIYCLYISDSSP